MVIETSGYAARSSTEPLEPFHFERREVGSEDVHITILYSGVCHSDISQARNHWGHSEYPIVPGHEIVGKVANVGKNVKDFAIGDNVGVGVFVDACGQCVYCKRNEEIYCDGGLVLTYNSKDTNGQRTQGGYSKDIVVKEKYVFKIPEELDLKRTAPLLCAGITLFSPMKHWGMLQAGKKIGVVGLGGLGHMAVKLGVAAGCEVIVISRTDRKRQDAKEHLGAKDFLLSTSPQDMAKQARSFDFILDTVNVPRSLDPFLRLLKVDGVMVMVGLPSIGETVQLSPGSLITKRISLAGSLVGGVEDIKEMLSFCAKYNITADVEEIRMQSINEAFERMIKSDVHYRFVIDVANSII